MQRYVTAVSARIARLLSTVILASLGIVGGAQAADVARDIREGRQDETTDFSGYFEVGGRFSAGSFPVVGADNARMEFTLGGHLRIRRFFVDIFAESYNRGQLGYNFYSGPTWSFDLIATGSPDGINTALSEELEGLRDRSGALEGGLRVTGYTDPFIVQFVALRDMSGLHEGGLLTGTIARQYLVRNWNLHWLLGARYQSAELSNFLFGVEADESSDRFPEYRAGAGITYVSEIGATLPINEYFVFRGTGRFWSLSDSMADSPLFTSQNYSEVIASVVFVY